MAHSFSLAPVLSVLLLAAAESAHAQWASPDNLPGPAGRAWEPQLGDFTGDGRLDVVMIEDSGSTFLPSPSHIVLFRGQKGGTYGFAEIVESLPSPASGNLSSRALQSADLDADGDLDLVALSSASTSSGEAWVLLNDGSGGFGSPMSIGPAGGSYSQIQIDDFNQDGLADIAIGSSFTTASGIHFGLGQGA